MAPRFQRNRYCNTADKLLRSIAEERGQLPTRSQVDLDVKGSLGAFDTLVQDENGTLYPVRK